MQNRSLIPVLFLAFSCWPVAAQDSTSVPSRKSSERLEALSPIPQDAPPPGYARLVAEGDQLWGGAVSDPRESGTLPSGGEHEWAVPTAYDLAEMPDFVRSRLVGRPIALGQIEDFSRYDLEGNPYRLSELWTDEAGRPVQVLALHWFAAWCGNSKAEASYLAGLHRAYGSRGLRIVGLADYSTPEELREYIATYKIPYLILPGTPNSKDEDIRSITDHYRYRRSLNDGRKWGTPFTVFLERGNTRHVTVVTGEMRRIPAEAFLHTALEAPVSGQATVAPATPASNTEGSP